MLSRARACHLPGSIHPQGPWLQLFKATGLTTPLPWEPRRVSKQEAVLLPGLLAALSAASNLLPVLYCWVLLWGSSERAGREEAR